MGQGIRVKDEKGRCMMVTFLYVVFGGVFFIAVARVWYRLGFRKGQESYAVYLESVKLQDRRAEKKMFIEGARE